MFKQKLKHVFKISFVNTDMKKAVEIRPWVRQGLDYFIDPLPISLSLMKTVYKMAAD